MPIKTSVYVDGFNLYYGCLKGTRYKWLNLEKLFRSYLPDSNIVKIMYFTAIIKGTASNPNNHIRQQVYLRALKTLPMVHIEIGHFLIETISLPLADGSGDARVRRSKEKGSDVNLATFLMVDACRNNFDRAVVVSGDVDFLTPVTKVQTDFRKEVVILDPQRDGDPNSKLNRAATGYKPIREGALADSQFPEHMSDAKGQFKRPPEWR